MSDGGRVPYSLDSIRTARDLMPKAEAELCLLNARATELIRPLNINEEDNQRSYVEIELGGGVHYGLHLDLIEQMISADRITEVPGCGAHIAGVVNWRGQLITVVELGCFFKVKSSKHKCEREILIVNRNSVRIGVIVDSVIATNAYAESDLETETHFGAGVESHFVEGVFKGKVVIIDLETTLSDRRLIVDDSVKGTSKN